MSSDEQVADRALVLGTVQALEHAATRTVRVRRAIDRRLERGGQRRERRLLRALRPGRRHHAGAELADHLLADVHRLGGLGDVVRRERQATGLRAIAVTRDAVLLARARSDRRRVAGGRGREVTGRDRVGSGTGGGGALAREPVGPSSWRGRRRRRRGAPCSAAASIAQPARGTPGAPLGRAGLIGRIVRKVYRYPRRVGVTGCHTPEAL